VTFDLAALGPVVRSVVMADIAEHQTRCRFVDYESDISADAHRPEVLILRTFDPVKLHPGIRRIHLKVESSCLYRLLLVGGQLAQAIGECVSDSEVHSPTAYPLDLSFTRHQKFGDHALRDTTRKRTQIEGYENAHSAHGTEFSFRHNVRHDPGHVRARDPTSIMPSAKKRVTHRGGTEEQEEKGKAPLVSSDGFR